MDIFDKCATSPYLLVAKSLMERDLYVYSHELQSKADTIVTMCDREIIMLGSNNYLGLTTNHEVIEAGKEALDKFGSGCSGSRFLNGTTTLHTKFERELAEFLGKEDCVTYGTGFQANLGIIGTVAGRHDIIFSDKENHASIYDACKLSYATTVRYEHNDMNDLEEKLKEAPAGKGKLIVSDGVFSMSGDICNLPEIVRLAKKYGARVMLDDAHSLGVLGKNGRGTADFFGLTDDVDIIMGTFSKSLASMGGFCVCSKAVADFLRHASRPYAFCAANTPATMACSGKALEIIKRDETLTKGVLEIAKYMRESLDKRGLKYHKNEYNLVPIISIFTYDSDKTMHICKELFESGVYVNPVLPPATNEGYSLIRTSLMATHTKELVDKALDLIEEVIGKWCTTK